MYNTTSRIPPMFLLGGLVLIAFIVFIITFTVSTNDTATDKSITYVKTCVDKQMSTLTQIDVTVFDKVTLIAGDLVILKSQTSVKNGLYIWQKDNSLQIDADFEKSKDVEQCVIVTEGVFVDTMFIWNPTDEDWMVLRSSVLQNTETLSTDFIPVTGSLVYDTQSKKITYHNGTQWGNLLDENDIFVPDNDSTTSRLANGIKLLTTSIIADESSTTDNDNLIPTQKIMKTYVANTALNITADTEGLFKSTQVSQTLDRNNVRSLYVPSELAVQNSLNSLTFTTSTLSKSGNLANGTMVLNVPIATSTDVSESKENKFLTSSVVSTNTTLGGVSATHTKLPTQKSVRDYIDSLTIDSNLLVTSGTFGGGDLTLTLPIANTSSDFDASHVLAGNIVKLSTDGTLSSNDNKIPSEKVVRDYISALDVTTSTLTKTNTIGTGLVLDIPVANSTHITNADATKVLMASAVDGKTDLNGVSASTSKVPSQKAVYEYVGSLNISSNLLESSGQFNLGTFTLDVPTTSTDVSTFDENHVVSGSSVHVYANDGPMENDDMKIPTSATVSQAIQQIDFTTVNLVKSGTVGGGAMTLNVPVATADDRNFKAANKFLDATSISFDISLSSDPTLLPSQSTVATYVRESINAITINSNILISSGTITAGTFTLNVPTVVDETNLDNGYLLTGANVKLGAGEDLGDTEYKIPSEAAVKRHVGNYISSLGLGFSNSGTYVYGSDLNLTYASDTNISSNALQPGLLLDASLISTDENLGLGVDLYKIPTRGAVKSYIDNNIFAASALVFRGVIDVTSVVDPGTSMDPNDYFPNGISNPYLLSNTGVTIGDSFKIQVAGILYFWGGNSMSNFTLEVVSGDTILFSSSNDYANIEQNQVSIVNSNENVTDVFGRTGNITAQANDYSADLIQFNSVANVPENNVQAAIVRVANNLDTSNTNFQSTYIPQTSISVQTTLGGVSASDSKIASQKAVKTYVDQVSVGDRAYADNLISTLTEGDVIYRGDIDVSQSNGGNGNLYLNTSIDASVNSYMASVSGPSKGDLFSVVFVAFIHFSNEEFISLYDNDLLLAKTSGVTWANTTRDSFHIIRTVPLPSSTNQVLVSDPVDSDSLMWTSTLSNTPINTPTIQNGTISDAAIQNGTMQGTAIQSSTLSNSSLTGVINSTGATITGGTYASPTINTPTFSNQTGTGNIVRSINPTLSGGSLNNFTITSGTINNVVHFNSNLGTPTGGDLTNCTIPISSVTATYTGTGNIVRETNATMISPTFTTPDLGIPSAGNLTNCTIPISSVTGTFTGSGTVVKNVSPTLVSPQLGTPASGNLSNCTNYPASALQGSFSGEGNIVKQNEAFLSQPNIDGGKINNLSQFMTGVDNNLPQPGMVLKADGSVMDANTQNAQPFKWDYPERWDPWISSSSGTQEHVLIGNTSRFWTQVLQIESNANTTSTTPYGFAEDTTTNGHGWYRKANESSQIDTFRIDISGQIEYFNTRISIWCQTYEYVDPDNESIIIPPSASSFTPRKYKNITSKRMVKIGPLLGLDTKASDTEVALGLARAALEELPGGSIASYLGNVITGRFFGGGAATPTSFLAPMATGFGGGCEIQIQPNQYFRIALVREAVGEHDGHNIQDAHVVMSDVNYKVTPIRVQQYGGDLTIIDPETGEVAMANNTDGSMVNGVWWGSGFT